MYGRPEWFVPKTYGWGLTPITWQGWVYAFTVGLLIAGPFNVLLFNVGWPYGVLWMVLTGALVCFDVDRILTAIKARDQAAGGPQA